MKSNVFVLVISVVFFSGCDSLRFAPSEVQKQNAWLHNRTAQLASDTAVNQDCSGAMKDLTRLSELQSRSFCADYGLPKDFPPAESVEDILQCGGVQIAEDALRQSAARPDIWQVTDGFIELGIALAGLFGGAYGLRAVQFLKDSQVKAKALKEIVEGNELFKSSNPESSASFKMAHKDQSVQTKKLVTELKQLDT